MSQEFQSILETIQKFMTQQVFPVEPQLAGKSFGEMLPSLNRLREEVKNLGLGLPQISKEYGGLGLTLVEHGIVSEELGKSPWGHYLFNCQAPDAGIWKFSLKTVQKTKKGGI